MLIFKKKQNIFNFNSLIDNYITEKNQNFFDFNLLINNYITEKNLSLQIKSQIDEYKKIIFYPSSTKEWFSSVYSYNKSYLKSLISYDSILNNLFKNYFNMLKFKNKILFKRRRDNKIRYSASRIFLSKAEMKHMNTNLLITLYAFNKQILSFDTDIRKVLILSLVKKRLIEGKTAFVSNYKNRVFHLLKNHFFIFRKWNMVFFKITGNLLVYLLTNIKTRYAKWYNISSYFINFGKKKSKLTTTLYELVKLLSFNKIKFNHISINNLNLGLSSLIEKLYKKESSIKLIDLKKIALNSDVFSSAVALKLRDRKNKAVNILRKAILQMVRLPDFHTLITFDDYIESINKYNIINTIKQQVVSGIRFEAAGRLTRRLTAMRSVFKYRYAGSLKDIRSSYNNLSSTILRGHAKSNSQYTLINSKTRNGTFGLKGWLSTHTFTIYSFSFMLLSSLLLTPIIKVISKLFNKDNGISLNNTKFIALATSVLNFFKSVILIFIFVFIPLSLEWDIMYFCILLLLTLGSIISLFFIYNNSNIIFYNNVDMVAISAGFYEHLVYMTIANSPFNDVYLFINIIIGLSMIMISLLKSNESISINKQILFILNNKKLVFIFYLAMFLSILIINTILLQIGLGIIVDTNSTTSFFYTYFSKIVSIRLIITAIFFYITNKLTLDNLSLSIFSVIVMFLFGSANYYIVMPYIKFVMSLGLIKIVNVISCIRLLVEDSSVRINNTQSLSDGIYNILKKLPILGKYLSLFNTNNSYNKKSGSFLLPRYNGAIKNKIGVYPLKIISKFTKIGIPSIVNTFELNCSIKGNFSNLKVFVKNNTLYFGNLISKLVPQCLDFTCKINLICGDQVLIINSNFKNGLLENLRLNSSNLDFAKSKGFDKTSTDINFFNFISSKGFSHNFFGGSSGNSVDSFYHTSENTRELLRLTKPDSNNDNLQVFMEGDFNSYNYNSYDYNIPQNSYNNDSYNNNNYIQEDVPSTEEQNSNLNNQILYSNNEMLYSNNQMLYSNNQMLYSNNGNMVDINSSNVLDLNSSNVVDWNNPNMQDLDSSNVIDWENFNMEEINNATMEDLDSSNVIGWEDFNMQELNNANMVDLNNPNMQSLNNPNMQNLNNPNMVSYLHPQEINPQEINPQEINPQEINPSIEQSSYNHHYIQETANYPENNNNLNYYYQNVDNLNEIHSNDNLNNTGIVPYLNTQQINPSTQQINPSTQQINPSTQYINPFAQNINPSNQDINPSNQEINRSTQEIDSSVEEVDFCTQDNITYLLEGLKTRMQNLFTQRDIKNVGQTRCVIKDIGIIFRNGEIVEGPSRQPTDFTRLLRGVSLSKQVGMSVEQMKFQEISTRTLYNKLHSLREKTLTVDEITFIHDQLASRISNRITSMNSHVPFVSKIPLSDLNLYCHNHVITELHGDVNSCLFTSLLERLYKEKPAFGSGIFGERNGYTLLRNIRTLLETLTQNNSV